MRGDSGDLSGGNGDGRGGGEGVDTGGGSCFRIVDREWES